MAATLVMHYNPPSGLGVDGGTTAAQNTTGVNLLVVGFSFYNQLNANPGTLSDSKSNSWTRLTIRNTTGIIGTVLYYCVDPTVGSSHTFTIGGLTQVYPNMFILGFGTANGGFDKENGGVANTNVSSIQPGSLSPAAAQSIFVQVVGISVDPPVSSIAIDSSWTIADKSFVSSIAMPGSMAYKIQTGGASAENPTTSWTNVGVASGNGAIFLKGNSGGRKGAKSNKGHHGGGGVTIIQPAGAIVSNIGNPGFSSN